MTSMKLFAFSGILGVLFSLSLSTSVEAQTYMRNLGTRSLEFSMEMDQTNDTDTSFVSVGPKLSWTPAAAIVGLDIYLSKYREDGTLLFAHELEIIGVNGAPALAYPTSIREASNGDFVITGVTNAQENMPIFLARTDPNGVPIFVNLYGAALSPNGAETRGVGFQVIEDNAENLVVVGSLIDQELMSQVPVFIKTGPFGGPIVLRAYLDQRFNIPGVIPNLGWGQFRDVEMVGGNGPNQQPGYVVTGYAGTNQPNNPIAAPYRELIVARLDLGGNLLWFNAYGPTQSNSMGTAIEVTSSGFLQVAGLAQGATHLLRLTPAGAPLSCQLVYGFTTLGDIQEVAPETFVFVGRDSNTPHEAMMLKMSATAAGGAMLSLDFARGYGKDYVEFFTDVRVTSDGGYLPTGGTSTWCRGPMDLYLVRTDLNGVVGCNEYDAQIGIEVTQYPVREIPTEIHSIEFTQAELHLVDPQSEMRFICPLVIEVDPWPWDWFVRLDANGDNNIDISDSIHSLNFLFSNGEAADPMEAADSNSDGQVDISDVIHGLEFLFNDGTPPLAPFPNVGPDPAQDNGHVSGPESLMEFMVGVGEVPFEVFEAHAYPNNF